jgi:hypothetical protein
MNPVARASGLSLLLYPVTMAVADQLQLRATPTDSDGPAREQVLADLVAVEASRGTFEAAGWLFALGAVLAIPMTLVLWRLAVGRSRRWAWAGAALGTCAVVGHFVQAYAHFGMLQVFSQRDDLDAAAAGLAAIDGNVYALALFVPFLLGSAFAVPVAAVGLWRAEVIPAWAFGSVTAGSALFVVLGSTSYVTVVWAGCLVVGLTPAAAAWLRRSPAPIGLEAQPAVA